MMIFLLLSRYALFLEMWAKRDHHDKSMGTNEEDNDHARKVQQLQRLFRCGQGTWSVQRLLRSVDADGGREWRVKRIFFPEVNIN